VRQARGTIAQFELAASKCQPEASNPIKSIHTITLHQSSYCAIPGLSSTRSFDTSWIAFATMSDVQVLKPDKDFSKEVDKQIPKAEQLAQVCRYS
jgi:hypothetical protein